MTGKIRICFVCLGNIVRSPLAENLFRSVVEEAGLAEHFFIDSAGTTGYHTGESPDARMRRVAARHGLVYGGRARQFQKKDFARFDLILAMDPSNRADLLAQAERPEDRAKVRLLRDFDPQAGPDASVPDPYYGGIAGFEENYRIIGRSCRGLLKAFSSGVGGQSLRGVSQDEPEQPDS